MNPSTAGRPPAVRLHARSIISILTDPRNMSRKREWADYSGCIWQQVPRILATPRGIRTFAEVTEKTQLHLCFAENGNCNNRCIN